MQVENISLSKPNDVSEAWWKEIAKKVKNAVLFIDDDIAESLHWSGHLEKLINAGATDIKEFSIFEQCDGKTEKAVFITGKPIVGLVADVLQGIIQSSNFKYVIVVTGAHPSVHAYAIYGGRDQDDKSVMNQIEEDILKWMGNMNYTVEIFYYPVILVPASEGLFLLPKFADLYPVLECDLAELNKLYLEFSKGEHKIPTCLNELEFHHLPFKFAVTIRHFISCMHSFLQGMNAREEIYCLGNISRIIASELEVFNPARQRRKIAPNKVSLIFVDRTLDLVAPTSYNNTTLMNRILSLLPRIPGQRIDSAVDLSPVCSIHSSCNWALIPGNFAHCGDLKCRTILNLSLTASAKETCAFVNREVLEVIKAISKKPSSSDGRGLIDNIKLLATSKDSLGIDFSLMQQALAVVECTHHPHNSHLDELHCMQKLFLQGIHDSHDISPMKQVIHLIATRQKKNASLDEILSLLVYYVSLGGPSMFDESLRYSMINAISQAILEDKLKLSGVMEEIVGNQIDEISALKAANHIWDTLKSISTARKSFKDFNKLHDCINPAEPVVYKNLLSQLLQDCLDPPQNQLTDLEYKSAGFRDIIKTGFSLFVNVSKPKPRDASLIIIYVIGGVTPCEMHELHHLIDKHKPKCQVLIGSSHLTYPSDAVKSLFVENSLLKAY